MNIFTVISDLHGGVWLTDPLVLAGFVRRTFENACGVAAELNTQIINGQPSADQNKTQFELVGRTAVIGVKGILWNNFSDRLYDNEYDITSTNVLGRIVQSVGNDPEIDSVLLVFDSPGGYSMGVPEVAEIISAVNKVKPVCSYVSGTCCSGAMWLASQSYSISATKSASTGSIGAYIAMFNVARMYENMGVKVEIFRSGPHKGMGMTGTELTEEQRGMLQAQVDKCAAGFKAAVRSGRGKNIADEFMQGQSFDVDAALACGLVDQVSTMDEALRDAAIRGKEKFA